MGKRKKVVYDEDDLKELQKKKTPITDDSTVIELYESKNNKSLKDEQNFIKVITSQCSPIKTVVETLNGLLPSANFCFTKSQIILKAININNSLVVNMELEAENFEEYDCQVEKHCIGIKLANFHKIINSIGSNNVLSLIVDKNDPNRLGIRVAVNEKDTIHNWRMNLLDTKPDEIGIIDINNYPVVISISSNYFQKICRDAGRHTTDFEISRGSNEQLILIFNSDNMQQETTVGTSKENLTFLKNELPDEIIQGRYSLKDLITFSKCTSISDRAIIYMSNTLPLMIQYSVGNLGKIQLFMKQVVAKN